LKFFVKSFFYLLLLVLLVLLGPTSALNLSVYLTRQPASGWKDSLRRGPPADLQDRTHLNLGSQLPRSGQMRHPDRYTWS